MNSAHVCSAIRKGLTSRRLFHEDVRAVSADGCSVNLKANADIERDYEVKWFLNICISHCTNNAGDQANFPTFATVWLLLMKVFMSDNAKILWERTTQCAWLSYSTTRWFSKYDVVERVFQYFGDVPALLEMMVQNNVSPASAGKLLNLLEDGSTKWHARIELSAYVECLFYLRNFCYRMEGNGDLIFTAATSIDELFETFPNRSLPMMPSTERLISQAVEWTDEHLPIQQDDNGRGEPAQRRTVNEVRAAVPRPRRAAAIERVRQATFAGETDARRRNREQREAQLEEARLAEIHLEAQEAAVAAEAADQALSPPRTRDEWMEHLKRGLEPSIHYVLDRFSEGGDRHQQVLVYRAARLFNPAYAKSITQGRAHALIETLRAYHPLNEDSIINSLKASWRHYKVRASLTIMTKEADVDVLQWHYDCWLENQKYLEEEMYECEGCLHCHLAKCGSCSCIQDLMCWWKAASLLALILPSSAPAERVFSILNHMWSDLQTSSLSDLIRTSMFLACNKRSL
jgi:hypothetical protein